MQNRTFFNAKPQVINTHCYVQPQNSLQLCDFKAKNGVHGEMNFTRELGCSRLDSTRHCIVRLTSFRIRTNQNAIIQHSFQLNASFRGSLLSSPATRAEGAARTYPLHSSHYSLSTLSSHRCSYDAKVDNSHFRGSFNWHFKSRWALDLIDNHLSVAWYWFSQQQKREIERESESLVHNAAIWVVTEVQRELTHLGTAHLTRTNTAQPLCYCLSSLGINIGWGRCGRPTCGAVCVYEMTHEKCEQRLIGIFWIFAHSSISNDKWPLKGVSRPSANFESKMKREREHDDVKWYCQWATLTHVIIASLRLDESGREERRERAEKRTHNNPEN